MDELVNNEGQFNPYEIHQRLGDELTDTCTVVREGSKMEKTYESLREMKEQAKDMRLSDTGVWTNQNLSFARALRDMLIYGEAILAASIDRTESRGSHYRPDYPDRNDEKFLKTTIAKYDADNDRPILEYEPVPQPMVEPRARTYGKVEDDAGDDQAESSEERSQEQN